MCCTLSSVYVPDRTGIWTVRVRSGPYEYFIEILIRSDRTRMVWIIIAFHKLMPFERFFLQNLKFFDHFS